jgi:hypothetical protein
MPIRTYDNYIDIPHLIRVDNDEFYVPGIRVMHDGWDTVKYAPGIIISVEYKENCKICPKAVTAFWSDVPPEDVFTMPNVRRVFSSLIANDICSVQPMTMPSGLIFYIDYKYGSGSSDVK